MLLQSIPLCRPSRLSLRVPLRKPSLRTLLSHKSRLGLLLLGALVAVSSASAGAGRLVAIADVHGAYDELVALLQEASLIDEEMDWIGGQTTLVQTGDFLDRGADVRKVMDLLRALQDQAAVAGGEVVVLLGNHEAMNLLGFRSDISDEAYASFANEDSVKRQSAGSRKFGKWIRQRAKLKKERIPNYGQAAAAAFVSDHPLGYFEYADAMRPEGEYGGWLRSLPMVAKRGRIAFLHGGISPTYTGWSIEELNQRMSEEIALLDSCRESLLNEGVIFETSDPNEMVAEGLAEIEVLTKRLKRASPPEREQVEEQLRVLQGCVGYEDWFLVKSESPIWYRGYARLEGAEALQVVTGALKGLGVDRFVVGHTPQKSMRVDRRLDGRLFLLDTGMLTSVYKGRPSALEFIGDQVTAIYLNEREVLEQGPGGEASAVERRVQAVPGLAGSQFAGGLGSFASLVLGVAAANPPAVTSGVDYRDAQGDPLPFASEADLIAFLSRGRIEVGARTDTGVNRPLKATVTADGITIDAVFRSVDKMERRVRTKSGKTLAYLRDTFRFEPAAYQLSALLGLNRVPVAVLRTVDGKRGSLQIWMHGMVDEEGRLERGLRPKDTLGWREQVAEQKLFDRLLGNVDRNQGNLLINLETEKVWLIDHTRAFAEMATPEDLQRVTRCRRTFYEALVNTSEAEVRSTMAPYLLNGEVDALWSRWDMIAKRLRSLLEEHGADVVFF